MASDTEPDTDLAPDSDAEPDTDLAPGTDKQRLELDEAKATRNLWQGLVSLAVLIVMVVGLLLAVPGLHEVAKHVLDMPIGWVIVAIVLEMLSCVGYVVAFLQVFDRAPVRFGARVALSELAFGAAVSLGGAGSIAVGAWLLIERGARPGRVAERSAVLFLLTSAVNLIVLAVVGLGTWLGIFPGDQDPLLSLLPGAVGAIVFFSFLLLPWATGDFLGDRPCGRLGTWSRATSETIRDTARILFSRDWRLVGAYGYLLVRHRRAVGVLQGARPHAADHDRGPRVPDRLPLESDPDPRRDRCARWQLRRHVRALRRQRHARHVSHDRLPRDLAVGAGHLGHGRVHSAAPQPQPADPMAKAASRAAGPAVWFVAMVSRFLNQPHPDPSSP